MNKLTKKFLLRKLSLLCDFDMLCLLIALLGMVLLFLDIRIKAQLVCVIGVLGLFYWLAYLCIWFFNPILRDWILVNSHIMRRIASGVLLTPFMLVFICYVFNDFSFVPKVEKESSIPTEDSELVMSEIKEDNDAMAFFMQVFYNFMDPGSQTEENKIIGFRSATLIAMLGVFFLNGLFVSTLVGWFDRRREQWLKGSIRYRYLFRFSPYVIIGGNEMAMGIVNDIFKKDKKAYILIETAQDVEAFRRVLYSNMDPAYCRRVVIYYGNRTSIADIRSLHLRKAQEVYILGEDVELGDKESYHDSLNMKCLELVAKTYSESMKPNAAKLKCTVMFEYQSTFSIFQYSEVSEDIRNCVKFVPFNRYEMWAQKVLICNELYDYGQCKYLPLEGIGGISSSDDHFVHLTIVGMSRMGIALAIEAAHLAHYPNFLTKKIRTRITFIDCNMEQEIDFFRGRFDSLFQMSRIRRIQADEDAENIYADVEKYPWIDPLESGQSRSKYKSSFLGKDILDIEWEFISGTIERPSVQQYLYDAANNERAKLTIAVCLPETNKAIAAAIYLPSAVFEKSLQVLIYQSTNDALIANLTNNVLETAYNRKMRSFGMLSDTFDSEIMADSEVIIDEVGRQYGLVAGEEKQKYKELTETLLEKFCPGYSPEKDCVEKLKEAYIQEDSQIEEKVAKLKVKIDKEIQEKNLGKTAVSKLWSNVYNANMMWTKLRCIGKYSDQFTFQQLWELANVEHCRWNMEQLLMLYRPALPEEQFLVRFSGKDFKKYNGYFKNKMVHYDLCSCDRLKEIDDSFLFDVGLTDVLLKAKRKLEEKHFREGES